MAFCTLAWASPQRLGSELFESAHRCSAAFFKESSALHMAGQPDAPTNALSAASNCDWATPTLDGAGSGVVGLTPGWGVVGGGVGCAVGTSILGTLVEPAVGLVVVLGGGGGGSFAVSPPGMLVHVPVLGSGGAATLAGASSFLAVAVTGSRASGADFFCTAHAPIASTEPATPARSSLRFTARTLRTWT